MVKKRYEQTIKYPRQILLLQLLLLLQLQLLLLLLQLLMFPKKLPHYLHLQYLIFVGIRRRRWRGRKSSRGRSESSSRNLEKQNKRPSARTHPRT